VAIVVLIVSHIVYVPLAAWVEDKQVLRGHIPAFEFPAVVVDVEDHFPVHVELPLLEHHLGGRTVLFNHAETLFLDVFLVGLDITVDSLY